MIYTYPHYYKKFNCIADKCPDTCCGKWQIVIDDDSLEKYQEYDGEYRSELHRKVNWKEEVFRHGKNGKCAFLRDDMLCDMYVHMGKDSLCNTCREYPRHTEEFENVREVSLSLSCPEAARIILNTTDIVTFVSDEDDEDEVFDDFDYFLYSNLEDIREEILRILQDRSVDIRSRIESVLQIGASAQRHYDEGDLVMWDELEEQDKPQISRKCGQQEGHEEYMLLQKQAMFLLEDLELLYDDWDDVLIESQELLFSDGEMAFAGNRKRFEKWWDDNCQITDGEHRQDDGRSANPASDGGGLRISLDIFIEQITVYFISIYLLGAVYDDNIVGKVDACMGHAVELYMLAMARWIKNGEILSMDDLIELAYRYSREIEHSDENLEQVEILDWFGR